MNLQELLAKLTSAQEKLEDANIKDDLEKIDLELLIEEIKRQMIRKSFEPLTEISAVKVPDISKLPGLIDQVQVEIENEEQRKAILGKIMSIAKTGLNVIGLPI